jgi:hypothetical protein
LTAPDVRISADQPGAEIEDVRGPTRTIVSVPEIEVKFVPGDVLVKVPGPTKGSRATSVNAAWLSNEERNNKTGISAFILKMAGRPSSQKLGNLGLIEVKMNGIGRTTKIYVVALLENLSDAKEA